MTTGRFEAGNLICGTCGLTTPANVVDMQANYDWLDGHTHSATPRRQPTKPKPRPKPTRRRRARQCRECGRKVLVGLNGRLREHGQTGNPKPCKGSGRWH